jgi:hypothetical protein
MRDGPRAGEIRQQVQESGVLVTVLHFATREPRLILARLWAQSW